MKADLVGSLVPDPAVKGVDRLLTGDGASRFVKDLAKEMPAARGANLTVVKQRVGQRALLRIDSADSSTRWYAKLRRRSASSESSSRDSLIEIAEEAERCGVRVPRPIAYLSRFRATIYEAADGSPILPCCAPEAPDGESHGDESFPPQERAAVFRATGRALASLHDRLPRTAIVKGRAFEREQIEKARGNLLEHRSDLRERFGREFDRWQGERSALEPEDATGRHTLHGDFYPAQVLAGRSPDSTESILAFLDWDNLSVGEAERDVANFSVHLDLECLRGHLDAEALTGLTGAFLEGYRRILPLDERRLAWYRRSSLLRLAALYASPRFGPSPPNDPRLPIDLLASS